MDQLANKVLDCLCVPMKNCISSEANFIISWEDNLDALGKDMSELKAIREDLETKVEAADRRGKGINSVPEERLQRAKTYEKEANKMDEKRKKMTKCLCGSLPLNIFMASKISKKAVALCPAVKELTTLCNQSLADVTRGDSVPIRFMEKLVGLTPGVESVLECLKRHVQDVNLQVIGVYGMPAAGKTYIIGQVNNQLQHAMKPYDYIIWVDMPQDSSIDEVQQAIGEKLAVIGDKNQNASQEEREAS